MNIREVGGDRVSSAAAELIEEFRAILCGEAGDALRYFYS